MKNKKIMLWLLGVLGFLLIYNHFIAPFLMLYKNRLGMGMHWRMYNNYNYFVDSRFIVIIVILTSGILVYGLIKPGRSSTRCPKCSKEIQDERWRVCPYCGANVNTKEVK
ncbi:MAG: zinc ribbon domain-containing protein [Clostridia bacterium]|nr:zinc ribbon domain-containing protein [Clostridia bacterium]